MIPRGQVLLASGFAKPDNKRFPSRRSVAGREFLEEAFRTNICRRDIALNDDGSWTNNIETELLVNGSPFNHHDTNTLKLVEAPTFNPLAVILKDRAKQN